MMFEQTFKNIDDILFKDSGADSELDDARLKGLFELKYNSIHDAKVAIGDIKRIRETFIGFQKYLYEDDVVNNYEDLGMVAEPKSGYGD